MEIRMEPDGVETDDRSKVLCVGLACVDFVNVVSAFPNEDSDKRGEKYYWQRGGNATNNCTVLTLLSTPCDFMGVLGTKGAEAKWIVEDFKKNGICTRHCVRKDVLCPVATVIVSREAGTRTIVYFPRDQPELLFEEFEREFGGDFSLYSWIHFELTSRVVDVCRMMTAVQNTQAGREGDLIPAGAEGTPTMSSGPPLVSVEIEKPEILDAEKCMNKADVVFISKDFAKSRGYSDAGSAVRGFYSCCRLGAILVCAWGEQGASACFGDDLDNLHMVASPALADITVVDSLGAGDAFVAGVIHSLQRDAGVRRRRSAQEEGEAWRRREKLHSALSFGCRVAGHKCTGFGYGQIKELV